jgi:hypothetical protein
MRIVVNSSKFNPHATVKHRPVKVLQEQQSGQEDSLIPESLGGARVAVDRFG